MYHFKPNYKKLKRFVEWNNHLNISNGELEIEEQILQAISTHARQLKLEGSINELLWFVLFLKSSGESPTAHGKPYKEIGDARKGLAQELNRISKFIDGLPNADIKGLRLQLIEHIVFKRGRTTAKRIESLLLDSHGLIQKLVLVLDEHRQTLLKLRPLEEWNQIQRGLPEDIWRLTKLDQAANLYNFVLQEMKGRKIYKARVHGLIATIFEITGTPFQTDETTKMNVGKALERHLKNLT